MSLQEYTHTQTGYIYRNTHICPEIFLHIFTWYAWPTWDKYLKRIHVQEMNMDLL